MISANNLQQEPAWYQDYYTSFLSAEAHSFLLYGDVVGLAHENVSHRGFLIAQLAQRRNVIVNYDIARGFTFPDPSMRENALALLNTSLPGQPVEVDPFEQALAGVGGSQGNKPNDPFQVNKPLQALRLIEQLLRAENGRGQVAVLIEYADALLPPSPKSQMAGDQMTMLVLLQTWARDSGLSRQDNPLFLLTRNLEDLHADLRRSSAGFKAVEIAYPVESARKMYITWYLDRRQNRNKPIPLNDLDVDELARTTAGLSLRNIEDILLLAVKQGGVTRLLVKARKDQIIATENSEVAEMLEPLNEGFQALGGMEKLIAWTKAEIIEPIRSGAIEDAPKGVLLVGPPGSGKTYYARALAREIGFNAVSLNLENILGSLVGESERKLQQFFTFCKSLAPVLVFLDELDQSDVSRRGTGSGNPVASNLFSAMLRFMGDETLRGKVVFLFASNRPDLIDPAIMRNGRIDAIIPVQLPNEAARYGIVLAQAKTQQVCIAEAAARTLATKAVKYSAADLMALVKKARKLTIGRADRTITVEDATRALATLKPSSPQLADWYQMLAVKACSDTDLLDPEEAALKDDPAVLQQKIKALKPEESQREEREY
ncbi:MAG: AAA family ATPase [Ktedonobacteraceae bacterium]